MKNKIYKKSEISLIVGRSFFKLGLFLLPAAFFFASIFLFISFIIAFIKRNKIFKDKWNFPLIICSILLIIVCLISNLNLPNNYNLSIDNNLNWLGLLNWIPMFWVFWCAQFYLSSPQERKSCAFFLVLGTIPILISGFGQYYFEWYGPIKFLNGTIIWYQRLSSNQFQSLTGPFNNPNYAGTWLAVIFPLSSYIYINSTKLNLRKVFYSFLLLGIILATFLTFSRNAIINIIIAFTLLIGISTKTIFFFFIFLFIFLSLIFIFGIPLNLLQILRESPIFSSFIPNINKFSEVFTFTRVKIWKTSIMNIFKNPLIGWGASSFPVIYLAKNGRPTFQHTHNLILEIAHNYGVIVSLILFTTLLLLIYKSKPSFSSKIKNNSNDLIDKYWWVSSFIILLLNMNDITYYDGRISLLFWILMSGLRCILRENNNKRITLGNISN